MAITHLITAVYLQVWILVEYSDGLVRCIKAFIRGGSANKNSSSSSIPNMYMYILYVCLYIHIYIIMYIDNHE